MYYISNTYRTSCRHGWPRGFGVLNSSPHSSIFTSVSVGSWPRSYSFTSAMGRIGVHTAPKKAQNQLSDMWRSTFEINAAQLRSFTEVAPPQPLSSVNSPIRYDFRGSEKAGGSASILWFFVIVFISWSNWNLKILVFDVREKPEYPEKNLSEQRRKSTTNSNPYGVNAGIWTGATLAEGECSNYCATPAPQIDNSYKKEATWKMKHKDILI